MRQAVAILILLLACSLAANALLLQRGKTRASRSYDAGLREAGARAGRSQAHRDFESGRPLWYSYGFGGARVPTNKPARKPVSFGCIVSAYEISFVESYNKTMDELLEKAKARDKPFYRPADK